VAERNPAIGRGFSVGISRHTSQRMLLLCLFCLLAVLQSSLGDSGASISVALAAGAAAVVSELMVSYRRYGFSKVADSSAAASALILTLLLPNHINPLHAAFGAAFAVLVVKQSFGGIGSNFLNPALGGWLFVRLCWPGSFADGPGASGMAEALLPETASAADTAVRELLNGSILAPFGAWIPPGYVDLFWNPVGGIIADRAVLTLVLWAAVVFAFRAGRWWTSLTYLAVFALLSRLLGGLAEGGELWSGDLLLSLLSGGTLVTAFILLLEPASSARSVPASLVLAVLAAVLSVLFRFSGGQLYGAFFALALVNALGPAFASLERFLLFVPYGKAPRNGGRKWT